MIKGKVFYGQGSYSISIPDVSAEQTEQIIRALKDVVLLRRIGYTG